MGEVINNIRITQISATYERRINLEPYDGFSRYDGLNVGITLTAEVEEGADPLVAAEWLRELARTQVRDEARRLIGNKQEGKR